MAARIIIAGGGFAGLAAARRLASLLSPREADIRLFDPNPHTTMIPSLPDLAGGRIRERYLCAPFRDLLPPGVRFHGEPVLTLDFNKRLAAAPSGAFTYDYLVVALGSVTDFHGFDQHRESIHTLDSLDSAIRLRDGLAAYLQSRTQPLIAVAGGGWTGMELAFNAREAVRRMGKDARIVVAERSPALFGFLPPWVRQYMEKRAAEYRIETRTGVSVSGYDGCDATLSDGTRLEDVFLCWTAGTRLPPIAMDGEHQQRPDGRLEVDDALRLPAHPEVFAAGDAAALKDRGRVLRKAVNFSRDSGFAAGLNVAQAILGRPLRPYKAVDLGWVIPLCASGVGELFSRVPVRGKLPLMLHYAMCGLRNYTVRNRLYYWKVAAGIPFARSGGRAR